MSFLRWLRQVICIHGPTTRIGYLDGEADQCDRCGAIVMRYRDG